MKEEYIEKIYAGWLAKIIGIRLGAPIEGWTYEKIRNIYGEIDGYPVDYNLFAADDDSNGPLFFLRALEDSGHGYQMKSQDVAEALLNYAPYEHGFFWWGGYGISTEHTAYLNLRNGIPAPRSGSIEQNGKTAAEQIGGQIFIDTWGLVSPGNPDLAAKLSREAASVTHGGNAVYGGIFIAVCISWAFCEKDIHKIIHKGLSYIPAECEYAKVVCDIEKYHTDNPDSWRECYRYIHEYYGYDRYPGNCHIIPNIAVMILALLYGNGDFSRTLNIGAMCGWDTDCNVGNIATIMGVRSGIEAIDYDKWRKPVNDFLACSSVVGSLNIMDIPYGASYICRQACLLSGDKVSEPWNTIIERHIDSCHFEYPGSTHAIRVRIGESESKHRETAIFNTNESAFSGERSLKIVAKQVVPGENVYCYRKTYYRPSDFHDSRYDPAFSPLAYPGNTLHCAAMIPDYGCSVQASLYVKDDHSRIFYGDKSTLIPEKWMEFTYKIPSINGGLISETGMCFYLQSQKTDTGDFVGMIDDLYTEGKADYAIDFAKENEEFWNGLHREISQFTKLKGIQYLEDGQMNLSCADFAESYTGRYDWKDYSVTAYITPHTGKFHMVNIRVQGAMRSYAVGLLEGNRIAILKNAGGTYKVLSETSFIWQPEKEYRVCIRAEEKRIMAFVEDTEIPAVEDHEMPYLLGSTGLSVRDGSHLSCRKMIIN
jgi:ADP-ribosylglycohydrolase